MHEIYRFEVSIPYSSGLKSAPNTGQSDGIMKTKSQSLIHQVLNPLARATGAPKEENMSRHPPRQRMASTYQLQKQTVRGKPMLTERI